MHESSLYPVYQGPGISSDAYTPCSPAAKSQPYEEMGSGKIEDSKRTRAEIPAHLISIWKKKKTSPVYVLTVLLLSFSHRTPAMIGCSFVVNRKFFGEIGLLDPGMDVYGGENIELGIKVGNLVSLPPDL